MNLKKIGKAFTNKFVGTGSSSFKKEFTGPQSHKGWETLLYTTALFASLVPVLTSLYMEAADPPKRRRNYNYKITYKKTALFRWNYCYTIQCTGFRI